MSSLLEDFVGGLTGYSLLPFYIGQIYPGFQASHMDWMENGGLFLRSKNSTFGFGFYTALDAQSYLLVIIHLKSAKVVWTANRGLLISDSDKFLFEKNGDVYLQRGDGVAWSAGTKGQRVTSMELMDSGNMVLHGDSGRILWQSFSYPTDTLLPGQEFVEGMRLKSFPNKNTLTNYLEIKSGDLVLYAGYITPQIYWSLANESRKTNSSVKGKVHYASLLSNSWNFYDQNRVLLWQFIFSDNSDPYVMWALKLGADGAIAFYNLEKGRSVALEATKIPQDSCSIPEPCGRYYVCYFDNWCQCPNQLNTQFGCKPPVASSCNGSKISAELFYVGEKLDYFALAFVTPFFKSNLNACKEACLGNCSCIVLFFENSTGSCFLFDQLGSLTRSQEGSSGYILYMKVSMGEQNSASGRNVGKEALLIAIIVIATIVAIVGLIYVGIWYRRRGEKYLVFQQQNPEEDDFWDSIPGMPARYSFSDLYKATKNFSVKVGQGGFGSVYLGALPDGTQLAVKKLEGIGQGKKEFRAEVSIIGSVHHVHLVKLKGFCAEGAHRLLVYEFMEKGSLDKWIFKNAEQSSFLEWNARYNIAVGMAKGLAYLHEECEVKIVHCDIKPQNVLLDDNFTAKVSDFGLAKLMNHEDSLVYTTVRGTRGYLAPEWITNNPISEKSDVYSYGVVLLEIIGGRKNYDSTEISEKSHFPSYSFKMLEEGRLREIIDPKLDINANDVRVVTAIKVALWCIQEEMQLRPPMTKVVQMLEGLCDVPDPPISSQSASRSMSTFIKWNSKECSSSGPVDDTSDAFLSDVRLSGPR
ncbi:G-type lectin S-receptor-like serine/threonine-protein kinase SD2-5 isoform X2 [Manihot esculenta]|uniref:Uncharacterized protein n=2 Tax=Manihot esculenta TaxID=3983 RepID=A0ACB7HWE4_MANES|nr:G-type lectin S-receptor-like serine/threonine-protein kinase SD2-5 isoform X2 [Manihot esculenta]KAG8656274.1 hypothetical protein MANES_04G113300v8 [Manihot esculenta]OAY52811.1 hypothetical protein MANES_04G113300v8 [Manihot esculenta]